MFKFNLGSLVADIEIDAPDLICAGDPIQFINNSIGGTEYEWSFGDLSSSDEENPEYIYATPGEWEIMLIVSDVSGSAGCLEPDTAFAFYSSRNPQPLIDEIPPFARANRSICRPTAPTPSNGNRTPRWMIQRSPTPW